MPPSRRRRSGAGAGRDSESDGCLGGAGHSLHGHGRLAGFGNHHNSLEITGGTDRNGDRIGAGGDGPGAFLGEPRPGNGDRGPRRAGIGAEHDGRCRCRRRLSGGGSDCHVPAEHRKDAGKADEVLHRNSCSGPGGPLRLVRTVVGGRAAPRRDLFDYSPAGKPAARVGKTQETRRNFPGKRLSCRKETLKGSRCWSLPAG